MKENPTSIGKRAKNTTLAMGLCGLLAALSIVPTAAADDDVPLTEVGPVSGGYPSDTCGVDVGNGNATFRGCPRYAQQVVYNVFWWAWDESTEQCTWVFDNPKVPGDCPLRSVYPVFPVTT